jgi:hypothetical protein
MNSKGKVVLVFPFSILELSGVVHIHAIAVWYTGLQGEGGALKSGKEYTTTEGFSYARPCMP